MYKSFTYTYRQVRWRRGTLTALLAAIFVVGLTPLAAQAQRGRGGGGGRVGGAVNSGVGAAVRAPNVGAAVSGATSGTVRVAPRVAVPNVGAAVGGTARVAPRVAVPNVGAAVGGTARVAPRVVVPNAGAAVSGTARVAPSIVAPNIAPRVNAAVNGAAANARIGAATGLNAGVDAAGVRTALRPNLGAQLGTNFRAGWHGLNAQQAAAIHANLRNAMAANIAGNVAARNYLSANPARLGVWSGWGNGVRSNFFVGASPFFGGSPFYTGNFFSGRTLLGLGLARAGLPFAGSAVAGYPLGLGLGTGIGWGYSPWLGYQPWNYWWGTPTWGGLTNYMVGYGLTQPYFYDYGTGGNVVYQGNQVLVNGQTVGTPAEYSQSAAELAAVDPAEIAKSDPKDWMALGTFSLATAQDEANPPRVMQLAVNKQGLISGTVFNRTSNKLYTVQGRVDPQTQRVAFTIGDHKDTVLETGLYNLTQEQTPILVHYGSEHTATYLAARLPMPEGSQVETQATQSANASAALPGINR